MWVIIAALVGLVAPQETLIDRVARNAESFWEQFTAVQCKERIEQVQMSSDGAIVATQTTDFNYVAFLKATTRGLLVEESRVTRSMAGKRNPEQQERLLITSGFPTFLLMFHPEFRDRFDFNEIPSGDGVRRIAFRSKPEASALSALKLKDYVYSIRWKGTATVDAMSGAVRKINAELSSPMDDLGLSELQVDVDYGSTALAGTSQTFWLPMHATISLKTPRRTWRNVHTFSDYKRFSVTTSTRETEAK